MFGFRVKRSMPTCSTVVGDMDPGFSHLLTSERTSWFLVLSDFLKLCSL